MRPRRTALAGGDGPIPADDPQAPPADLPVATVTAALDRLLAAHDKAITAARDATDAFYALLAHAPGSLLGVEDRSHYLRVAAEHSHTTTIRLLGGREALLMARHALTPG